MTGAMEQWGWAWMRATFPPSVASRDTPTDVSAKNAGGWDPERLASGLLPSFPACQD